MVAMVNTSSVPLDCFLAYWTPPHSTRTLRIYLALHHDELVVIFVAGAVEMLLRAYLRRPDQLAGEVCYG